MNTTRTEMKGLKEELIACFRLSDLPRFHTGRMADCIFPVPLKKAHKERIPHIITRLYGIDSEGKRFLVQKRSELKERHRGRWTDTASGHVRYAPNFSYEHIESSAVRELKEEMGVELLSIRFIDMQLFPYNDGADELAYNFLAICGDNPHPDYGEVDKESGYYTGEELAELLKLDTVNGHKAWVETARERWKEILAGKYDSYFSDMLNELRLGIGVAAIDGKTTELTERKVSGKNLFGTALIIGRFQPFHKGHLYLIRKAADFAENIIIGIGSSQFSHTPDNPLSYTERETIIRKCIESGEIPVKKYRIVPIPDKFNLYKWIDTVVERVGRFDAVVTNNLWIGRLFQKKRKHILTGFKLKFERYNGTRIRRMVLEGNPQWKEDVPSCTAEMLEKFGFETRLKKILGKGNNPIPPIPKNTEEKNFKIRRYHLSGEEIGR